MRRRECVAAPASRLFFAWAASAVRSAAAVLPAGAAAIESAKPALLAELVATRHRVARDLVELPAPGIEASADTRRALAASSRVERVTEDAPRRPQR